MEYIKSADIESMTLNYSLGFQMQTSLSQHTAVLLYIKSENISNNQCS